MAKKRTRLEIEADKKRIFEAAKTATSIADLSEATSLSPSQIHCTVGNNGDYLQLKEQLVLNRKNSKNLKASAEEPTVAQVPAEAVANVNLQDNLCEEVNDPDFEPHFSAGFVIDASIMGLEDADIFLDRLATTEGKIILTSVTIKKLDKMQSFQDDLALCARRFLSKATKDPEHFISVQIDESIGIPDNCIIAYCREHRDKVTLLTSDKIMALNARSYPYPVKVQYFATYDSLDELKQSHAENAKQSRSISTDNEKNRIRTLIPAKLVNGSLRIFDFETCVQSICVISNGKWHTTGPLELHIGDDILIATKKSSFVTFAHYRLISLEPTDNCELIFDKRLALDKEPCIKHPTYTPFLENFWKAHNL